MKLRNKPITSVTVFIFIAFSVFYISITRGHFIGTDEIALYQTTRSLWESGDLSISHINNTFQGRYGRYYSQYNPGQAIAALPLYGLGKQTGTGLRSLNMGGWVQVFSGPSIGQEPNRWGGDIEIFFVNLFNCFITALLCSVFFLFSVRTGTPPPWALLATALLGVTSYIAPFSTGFLQHSGEALLLLSAFYFLFVHRDTSKRMHLLFAGILSGIMILFRLPSAIALPSLFFYLFLSMLRQKKEARVPDSLLKCFILPVSVFSVPIFASFILHLAINFLKFETIWGKYNNEGFHTPLFKGLYGFLFSPGNSIFLFTPLLILIPWTFRHFWKKYPLESLIVLGLSFSYLVLYGTYTSWHGLWSALGPRYLMPIVPLLLLPLGHWMSRMNKKVLLIVGLLAAVGLWVQLVHVAVNFAFVYHYEQYPDFQPPYGFLFIPDAAPLIAHMKAFFAGDFRVDMWVVNIYRHFGPERLMIVLIPLLSVFGWALWMLRKNYLKLHSQYFEIQHTDKDSV